MNLLMYARRQLPAKDMMATILTKHPAGDTQVRRIHVSLKGNYFSFWCWPDYLGFSNEPGSWATEHDSDRWS